MLYNIDRKQVAKQRRGEKAEEIRALKVRQQKSRMQHKQEEDEIQELMKEVESRREMELRARIEREGIKKQIRDLDTVRINIYNNLYFKYLYLYLGIVGDFRGRTETRISEFGERKGTTGGKRS